MGAEQTPPTGQEPASGTGQEPTTASGQAPETTQSLAEVQAALQAARREAAAHRTEAAALKKAQADAEAAKLSDLEKATKRASQLEAEIEATRLEARDKINRYEVQLAASRLGIVDPEAAVKLLDWDGIEYAEDGSPKHVERALKELLAKKPYLAAQQGQPSAAGATNPPSGRSRGQLTMADVRTMTPQQINTRWREVQAALTRGV